RKKVANQAKVIGQHLLANLWNIPTRKVGMEAIHESCVVAHLGRHWPKQVADPLLMFDIHIEIPNQYDAPVRPYALLASTKLSRLHVTLHDVDTVFLVKGYAGNFVKAHHVILTDESSLTVPVVNKHLGHCCFAT